MAQTNLGLMPGDPGFEILPVPASPGANIGRIMNREAIARLALAHAAGWSHTALADLYERLKDQIVKATRGWRADRANCADGSYAFIGSNGPVLVIMPDRSIYTGTLGTSAADGLVYYTGMVRMPDGKMAFPKPNPRAPRTTKVC